MDVLEYWSPPLDWTRFSQGATSGRMWAQFGQLVQLCHAHGHWERAAQQRRLSLPIRPLYGSEGKYQRNKRRDEWRREIERAEGHMYRAACLTAETITDMSYLLTKADEGTPDWNLYWSLRLAVGHQPNHERARCKVAAISSFDADEELMGQPGEIATRWLRQAGYSDMAV